MINRDIDETWVERYRENGLETDGKTYLWIPTKAKQQRHKYKTEVATILFPIIVFLIGLVLFINNFDLISDGFKLCLEAFK